MNKTTLSALIGLAGAIGNNGKTENTDALVWQAFTSGEGTDLSEEIRREKYRISPSCETCQTPCGNTSDYPMENFDLWPEEQKRLKEQVLAELKRIISGHSAEDELPEIVYKAISYVGYDLNERSYINLLEELKSW